MSRKRLRLTLGYVICKHYQGSLRVQELESVKRAITMELLKIYGIRKNTEIKRHDWLIACQHALELRKKQNTFCTIRKLTGNPTYKIVNALFGIG